MSLTQRQVLVAVRKYWAGACQEGDGVLVRLEIEELRNELWCVFVLDRANNQLTALSAMEDATLADGDLPGALAACNAWNEDYDSICTAFLGFNGDDAAVQIKGALRIDAGMTATVEDFCAHFPITAARALVFLHVEHHI